MGEWIEWNGGLCPVPTGTLVDIVVRSGKAAFGVPANKNHSGWPAASPCFWRNDGDGGDIIRYRVVGDEAEREPDTPVKTLRDEFAMAALGGLLGRSCDHLNLDDKALFLRLAEGAYALADAMLAARKDGK